MIKQDYYVICDLCGRKNYYPFKSLTAAEYYLTYNGWLFTTEKQLCPDCAGPLEAYEDKNK